MPKRIQCFTDNFIIHNIVSRINAFQNETIIINHIFSVYTFIEIKEILEYFGFLFEIDRKEDDETLIPTTTIKMETIELKILDDDVLYSLITYLFYRCENIKFEELFNV